MLAISLVATSLVAGVARAAAEAHGVEAGAPAVNWWHWETSAPPVGWFIVDFILFVTALVYFAKEPIRAAFLARHERVKKAVTEADLLHKRANDHFEEYRTKLANVDAESMMHVMRGKADGAQERDQIIAAAREYSERLRADALAVAEQEIAKAKARLREQVALEILARAEEILRRSLTDDDRRRLLDEAIADLATTGTAPAERPQSKTDASAGTGEVS